MSEETIKEFEEELSRIKSVLIQKIERYDFVLFPGPKEWSNVCLDWYSRYLKEFLEKHFGFEVDILLVPELQYIQILRVSDIKDRT